MRANFTTAAAPAGGVAGLAASRHIRRSDLVSCEVAFIDCRLPGSTPKGNYSIIGPGVTQSPDQVVNLAEPHGFAIGVAEMPNGITNNLHMHFTAEVFLIYRGEWLFRWGGDGTEGEIVGRAGDVVSIPTWIFRGFTNIGPDDGWIFTVLGRDESGGVLWHPSILRAAAEHGMYLSRDNMLIDTEAGMAKPAPEELIEPLPDSFIAGLQRYSVADLAARTTTADERQWRRDALLDAALPGHASALAPVIGPGMSQARTARAKVNNPHGFSVEWLRIEAGNRVGPYSVGPKQVFILEQGDVEIELEDGSSARLGPWDIFSAPKGVARSLQARGEAPAILNVVTAGDGRAVPVWPADIVAQAFAAGVGVDPDFYLAPAAVIPHHLRPAGA
jgi:quercetin dioxygenase-like cupin family protein